MRKTPLIYFCIISLLMISSSIAKYFIICVDQDPVRFYIFFLMFIGPCLGFILFIAGAQGISYLFFKKYNSRLSWMLILLGWFFLLAGFMHFNFDLLMKGLTWMAITIPPHCDVSLAP